MPEARNVIEIDRPRSEVFRFLADGENDRLWRSGVLDVRRTSGTGAGAIYRQGVKGPFGRRIAADYEITAFEPEDKIVFRAIAGPVRPAGSYELEKTPAGTRVTFALSATPTGLAKLMGPIVAKTMRSEVSQLSALKRVLEGGPSRSDNAD